MAITLDSWYSELNSEWMRKQIPRLHKRYMAEEITISPHLHHLVYGETLPRHRTLPLSGCVENHLRIIYGPAGGINTNDYRHIPMEFRRHFYSLLEGQSTDSTCSNGQALFDHLETIYDLTGPLASVIVWYYTYSVETYQIMKNDANNI